jgi:hypothetical protein
MNVMQLTLPFNINLSEFMAMKYPGQKYVLEHQALDARKANHGRPPVRHYQIRWLAPEDSPQVFPLEVLPPISLKGAPPIIVGSGPAGLFAALRLLSYGIAPLILEAGDSLGPRRVQIARCWRYGELDPQSNVYLGEGGAGLFSDGKLMSRTKSPLKKVVYGWLARMGVPESILVDAHPHVGSDGMKAVLARMRAFLGGQGCQILYRHQVAQLRVQEGQIRGVITTAGQDFSAPAVFLATGQSSDALYLELARHGAVLTAKDLAVGVRLENPASFINQAQYGQFASQLPPARYTLKAPTAYSFCMCPGGHVINASSLPQGIVVNGMSNQRCNSAWSNAAIVVPVSLQGKSFQEALAWQRGIEQKAYQLVQQKLGLTPGNGAPERCRPLPAQTLADFMADRVGQTLPGSSPSTCCWLRLDDILGDEISQKLRQAFQKFERQMPGLIRTGLLYAPETRTSSAVKIQREADGSATGIRHLWPCGEGFGYGGGIVTAAIDGIKAVDAWIGQIKES